MTRRHTLPAAPLLAMLVACLAPGCTDLDSMPTEPTVLATSDWTELYAPVAYAERLISVWAMDADDAWFGGDGSVLLHYDGTGVVRHDLDSWQTIRDLDGCATDEVWGVTYSIALRWDGRDWTEVPLPDRTRPNTVLCEAPDRVYVAGRHDYRGAPDFPVICRWTGSGWKDWVLTSEPGEVLELWRPHADGPLFAIVEDTMRHVYRVDDGDWQLMDWRYPPLDADGDLLLLDNDDHADPGALYRLDSDHGLTPICEHLERSRVLQSRAPMLVFSHALQYTIRCLRRDVLGDTPENILDAAVPERPGPTSNTIFVAGEYGMAMVGTWRSDWTMQWRKLSPIESYDFREPMLGNDTELFIPYVTGDSRGLFVQTRDGWHLEPLGYIPDGLRFLAGGDLLVWNQTWGNGLQGEIHRRDAAGDWHALPPTGRTTYGVWGSTEDDLVAMAAGGVFLRLQGGEWVVQDELGGNCFWFDGSAPDRLFAEINLPRLSTQRVLEFDGSIWRDITPDGVETLRDCYLAPFSGTLHARGKIGWNYVPMRYRDGQWEPLPGSDDQYVDTRRLLEAADGGLYYRDGRRIYRWHPGGWKKMYEHERSLRDYFVDPDHGVHVLDDRNRLHHHPYRPR